MPRSFLLQRQDRYPLSAAELWEPVGNTEHVNRLLGLPQVTYTTVEEDALGLHRRASSRTRGIRLTWREYPFDWVRNQSHSVLREYAGGPIMRMQMGIELDNEPDGCRMRQFAEVTPRWPLSSGFARRYGLQLMAGLDRFAREHVANRKSPAPVSAGPFPRLKPAGVHQRTLDERAARLFGDTDVDPIVLLRLTELLREGSDDEVLRMRPFGLARAWGLDRDVVLRTFLHATKSGLLELDWELMCPNCRVPKQRFGALADVADEVHCDLCGIGFAAELDRTTELRFSVHPRVRHAVDATYCIGGPQSAEHILVQQGLRPQRPASVETSLPDETLRVRVLRLNRSLDLFPDASGPDRLEFTFDGVEWRASSDRFRPGRLRVSWRNAGTNACTAVIERWNWDPDAATAARVMAVPEFRAMFSSEVLQPGRQIGIRNLCLLFSDLKDSTALYEQVGDAPAYGRVHRHFDFLIECFVRHEGGIVKTIGDAVMASFPSPEQALRAAIEVQQRIDEFNGRLGLSEPIVIKLGLHHGPAIAVNANGQMDYFGRTVNIAARIQGLSRGGDIVFEEALLDEPGIGELLGEAPFVVERFAAELKGVSGRTALCRLTPGSPSRA